MHNILEMRRARETLKHTHIAQFQRAVPVQVAIVQKLYGDTRENAFTRWVLDYEYRSHISAFCVLTDRRLCNQLGSC